MFCTTNFPEALIGNWCQAPINFISCDIPAPDVNTNGQIMAWLLDTYLSTIPPQERHANVHVVTGKPNAIFSFRPLLFSISPQNRDRFFRNTCGSQVMWKASAFLFTLNSPIADFGYQVIAESNNVMWYI